MDSDQRADFDATLGKLSEPGAGRVVRVAQNAYGKMVPVTEERLAEIQGRNARMAQMTSK